MIRLYCRHKEGNRTLCRNCIELEVYAHERLEKCPFGNRKKSCRKCRIHCYNKTMAARIKEVMRYSGPRMLLYHPLAALRHAIGF